MADREISVRVRVRTVDDEPVAGASVRLTARDQESRVTFEYDPRSKVYVASGVAPGEYVLAVGAEGYEPQERRLTVAADTPEQVVVLGRPGMRHYYRGRVKVPFAPLPDLIGLKLRGRAEGIPAELDAVVRRWNLRERSDVPPQALADRARVYTVPPDQQDEVLAALRDVPSVSHAGALVRLHGRSIAFLTSELIVRFRAAVPEERARAQLAEAGMTVLRRIPYIENAYHVAVQGPPTYAVLDQMEKLASRDDIDWVEPNLVTTVELDQIVPHDFLWPGVWDRQLVGTPAAWEHLQQCGVPAFGSPEIVIAFVDQGIESIGGVPAHPEYQGEVSDGTSKVYRLFDFDNLVPNNDGVLGDHGMGVSGVGAAKANNDAIVAGQDEGLAGAAPNCRVMGLIYPASESDQLDMYVWAAGFDPGSPRPGFPAPISPGADVFSTSIGFGSGAPISAQAAGTFDFLVANGRGGRGCLCFFSAGNADNEFTTYRPWAAYANNFGMAASTLDDDGSTEIRAPYSGFGPAELCAPSHDEYTSAGILHNPPVNFGTWSAQLVGTGNLVGHAGVQTTLAAAAAPGDTQVTVANAANFLSGGQLLLGLPGTPGSEPAGITGAPNVAAGTIPVTALLNAHAAGTPVVSGANNYRNDFGGTSSATPLAAGVAALVLSANPALTVAQLRQILRETAVKIDPDNADPVGEWLDVNGNPSRMTGNPPVFSQWYGHGRIDAAAAVRKAAKMKDKTPRTLYRYSVKFVCGKCEGKILARGHYFTAINVHNPSSRPVRIHKTISTALPGETPGHVVDAGDSKLGPFESFEIDCPDIHRHARIMGGCLLKGFVILTSRTPLEIVAVYSAAGADKEVETIHTERVPPLEVREDEEEKLPDLVPVPPFPQGPPPFPHLFCRSPRELAVIVRNQGEGDAPASKLQVDFHDCGQSVVRDVPPLPAGQDSAHVIVRIPEGCWKGELMHFRITVNSTNAFEESDAGNNSVESSCVLHL